MTTYRYPKVGTYPSFHGQVTKYRLATVQKIIQEILSNDLSFAKDARDLLIECCVEFITLISSEANEIAEKEAKKTIAAEHVVRALKDLGFEDYIEQIQEVAQEHKEHQKVNPEYPLVRRNLLTRTLVPRKEADQDGAEWLDGGGIIEAAGGVIWEGEGQI